MILILHISRLICWQSLCIKPPSSFSERWSGGVQFTAMPGMWLIIGYHPSCPYITGTFFVRYLESVEPDKRVRNSIPSQHSKQARSPWKSPQINQGEAARVRTPEASWTFTLSCEKEGHQVPTSKLTFILLGRAYLGFPTCKYPNRAEEQCYLFWTKNKIVAMFPFTFPSSFPILNAFIHF